MRLSMRVPLRRLAVAGIVVAGCGVLAACGGGTSIGGLGGLFGGDGDSTPKPAATTATQLDPSYFEKTLVCPRVQVREGTESLRVYERGGEDDPARVRYQASIGDTARECRNTPDGGVSIRVGVSGRVIAGPKGASGNISVPIRIVVLKDGKDVVYSKLHKVTVTLSPPAFGDNFSLVDDQVAFAVDQAANYSIFVGYDDRGK